PRNGICGLPFTIVGTARPAALCASSTRSFAFSFTLALTRSLPSPSPVLPVSAPAAPPAGQSSSIPGSPPPIPCSALLQKRQPLFALFRSRLRSVETPRGSLESAQDGCIPCLRIPAPAKLLPIVANRPCRRHR